MKLSDAVQKIIWPAAAVMLAAAAAAQGPVTSRDPGEPSVLVVQGLNKPFQAVVGDIVHFVLQPSTSPNEPILGLTVAGVPRLKTIAETAPYEIEWDTAGYAPGLYRIRQATVLPNGARVFGPIIEMELLQEQPISIQLPKEPSGAFPVSAEGRGGYILRRLEMLVDGRPAGTLTSLPGKVMIDSAALTGGPHVLWVRATDQKDREFVSQPVFFTLPELIKLVQPSGDSQLITSAGNTELRLVAEHNLGDKVKRVEFTLDGQVIGEASDKPYEFVWRGPLSSGAHRLTAAALLETGETIRSREVMIYAVVKERETPAAAAELVARIKPALVLVEAAKPGSEQTASASGFFINSAGYLVTSNHVTEGATGIAVRFADGRRWPGRLAASDVAEDIAVLVVSGGGQDVVPLGEDKTAAEGMEIGVAGFPYAESLKELGLGVTPSFSFGTINALRSSWNAAGASTKVIQFDAPIAPGLSGAPLFDKGTGKVLGVVRSGVVGEVSGPTGINLAVRVGVLRRLLGRAGIAFTEEWRR